MAKRFTDRYATQGMESGDDMLSDVGPGDPGVNGSGDGGLSDQADPDDTAGDTGGDGGDGESADLLPGQEPLPEYIPLSSLSTATESADEEGGDAPPIDADMAGQQEFFGAILGLVAPTIIGFVKDKVGDLVKDKASGAVKAIGSHLAPSVRRAVRVFDRRRRLLGLHESASEGGAPSALEVVIGADDRVKINATTVPPWSGICQLNITAQTGARYVGTGWLISERCVITAGHCVFMRDAGGWAKSIEVIPGRNGNAKPFGSVSSSVVRSLPQWVSASNRNFDCGCIILPRPMRSPAGGAPFKFGYAAKADAQLMGRALNMSGYPGDKMQQHGITQWFHARLPKSLSPNVITYDIDSAGGQSGSPVWHYEAGKRTAVGIHTNGAATGNSATRLTPALVAQFNAWKAMGP